MHISYYDKCIPVALKSAVLFGIILQVLEEVKGKSKKGEFIDFPGIYVYLY